MSAGTIVLAALLVAVGGGLGSVLRWGLREGGERVAGGSGTVWIDRVRPWTTVLANVLACFLLGVIVAQLGSAAGGRELAYIALAIGFCGGLSTLSTAAQDLVELVRRTAYSIALAYLMLSVGSGMAALWLGLVLAS